MLQRRTGSAWYTGSVKMTRRVSRNFQRLSARDCLLLFVGALAVLTGTLVGDAMRGNRLALRPESTQITIKWLPETVKHWSGLIEEMGAKYRVDPNYIAIIMTVESGGYAKAESGVGAKGLMQVTGPTAGDIAKKYLKEPRDKYDMFDPRTNVEFGAAYLAYLRNEFGTAKQGPSWNETAELVAAGYNGGPGAANNLEQGKGLTSSETVIYSRDVFNMWRERHAGKSPTYDRWVERGGSTLLDYAKTEQ
jgi:hypothetical protein